MGNPSEIRRHEATKAVLRYFALVFIVICAMSGVATYAVWSAHAQQRDTLAARITYCKALEQLKTQNREDIADQKKNYRRNLRLLHLKDTPELRKIAEKQWAKDMRRNAPRHCPYTN